MKYKNLSLTAALAVGVFFLSGCAQSVEDEFAFGSSRISCANQTVTVELPFPLGVNGAMAEAAPRNVSTVNAEGRNAYMQVLVMGDAGETDIRAAAAKADAGLRGSQAVSNLKSSADTVMIDGAEAVRLTYSFTDTERGRSAPLTIQEYIFAKDGVLWRVIYQYRSDNETGRALGERVAGKIRFGAHF